MTELVTMPTENGDEIELQIYRNILFGNFENFNPEKGLNYVRNFNYKPSDIMLCTYPKCGHHWLNNIIWKLKTLESADKPSDTFIEFAPTGVFETQEDPRVIFSHMKPNHLFTDAMRQCKIVLVFRNPKDVLLSYFLYLRNAAVYKNKQTLDEFFRSFISGILPHGSYFDYLQEWDHLLKEKVSGSCRVQVEVFYYEDFLLSCKENLMRLNTYLGFNRDEKYLDRVLEETSLEALRKQDGSSREGVHFTVRDEEGNSVIYRKGKVGDWKNHLTVAQSEEIDKLMARKVLNGMIAFKYNM